jgi:hypothetical protein
MIWAVFIFTAVTMAQVFTLDRRVGELLKEVNQLRAQLPSAVTIESDNA